MLTAMQLLENRIETLRMHAPVCENAPSKSMQPFQCIQAEQLNFSCS